MTAREFDRAPTLYGELAVGWWTWNPGMPKLTARLTDPAPHGSAELLPPLTDVTLQTVTNRHLILRGVQTLTTSRGKVEVMQEWIIAARLD